MKVWPDLRKGTGAAVKFFTQGVRILWGQLKPWPQKKFLKIAAVWVFLIKHYQLNSRHKKDNCFPWFHHLFQSPSIGCRTTTFNSWSSRLSHTILYKVFSTEKTWNDQTASEVLLCGLFLFCELSDNRNYNSFKKSVGKLSVWQHITSSYQSLIWGFKITSRTFTIDKSTEKEVPHQLIRTRTT